MGNLLAILFYAFALFLAVWRIQKEHRTPSRWVNLLVLGGMVCQAFDLVQEPQFWRNFPEIISLLGLFLGIIYLIMQSRGRWGTLSIFILPSMLICLIFYLLYPRVPSPSPSSHIVFISHVILVLAGIGGIFTGLFYAILYELQAYELKHPKKLGALFYLIPSLHACNRFSFRSLIGGFYLFTAGILLGFLWSYMIHQAIITGTLKELAGIASWVLFGGLVLYRKKHFHSRRSLLVYLVGMGFIGLAFLSFLIR